LGCGRLNVELLPLDPGPSPADDGGISPDASGECAMDSQDPSLCGGCETACDNQHGTNACVDGLCRPTCSDGYADCDGTPSNGCEANLNADPRHCGGCPQSCADSEICDQG